MAKLVPAATLAITLIWSARTAVAATLMVSPAAISNNYSGEITLQIGGITNAEPVIIHRYLDLNSNGSVDSNEPLIDTFRIMDGGVSTIGGVTNINVPFDRNSTPGAITTKLSVAAPLELLTGQYLFQLASPFNNFPPVTTLFSVTNAALTQSISGTIYANGSPKPFGIAVVLTFPETDFAGASVADASGHYQLKLPVGLYAAFPVFPGHFTDQSLLSPLDLTAGTNLVYDLYLTNGTVAISGQVIDATNLSGLGGVFIQAQSDDLFSAGFSDSNGNYSVGATPGTWKLKIDSPRLARRAYVTPDSKLQVDTTGGSVSGRNIPLPKGNALFYGTIQTASGVPLANIDLYSQQFPEQSFSADGFSDPNGHYAVAVLAGAVQWNCFADPGNNPTLADSITSSGIGLVQLNAGQAVLQDLFTLPVTTHLSGKLTDIHGNPVPDIGIGAYAMINGVNYNSIYMHADADGNYSIGLADGSWSLFVNCCGPDGLDSRNLIDASNIHSIAVPPLNPVLNLTLYPVGTPVLSQPQQFPNSAFGFVLNGKAGLNYSIQYSLNLNTWSNLFSGPLPFDHYFFLDSSATNAHRHYRAILNQ